VISLIDAKRINRLLCIGAHPDDIELGAGGTVMRLVEQNPGLHIHWLVLCGADPVRAGEARSSAALFTAGAADVRIEIHSFEDAFLPWQGEQLKKVFEALKNDFQPDLVLTHYEQDRHQDHRIISQLSWNTWRDHAIFEYEILKWDGDMGQPNVFVPIEEALSRRKVRQVYDSYVSQRQRHWFSEETFLALMRLRGVECNSGYAEAFYARKIVW
jgi:LmbE family N-acetylglucosaminyl deacetylase